MVLNKVPKEIRPKVKVFLNAVDKHFSFLKNYNYKVKNIRIATEYAVDNIIEITYINKELNREIIIHYEPNNIDGDIIDLISVTFNNNRFNLNKELEFDIFIEKYNSKVDVDNLNYPAKNSKGSFKENMETSISGYAYFLKDIGINLVNGTEWEDGLVYDWSAVEDILYQAQKDVIYGGDNDDNKDDDEQKKGLDKDDS